MPLVYRLAARMLRETGEAEDVTQEVFLRIHRSFDTYDPTRPLSPWVARTTYHACLRRLQAQARSGKGASQSEALDLLEDSRLPTPEQAAEGQEATALLEQALAEISAQDRALLDLRYREGLSDSEVAEATGMPVNTVKTRIFRARGRLRAWLAPFLSED
jgi:RNA polymerase sigma-70 factor (ECF subfamily)